VRRCSKDSRMYLFVMNFDSKRKQVLLGEGKWRDLMSGRTFFDSLVLEPHGVLILEKVDI